MDATPDGVFFIFLLHDATIGYLYGKSTGKAVLLMMIYELSSVAGVFLLFAGQTLR
jgi:hypothetical protein